MRFEVLIILTSCLLTGTGHAANEVTHFNCPLTLPTGLVPPRVVDGWTVAVPGAWTLDGSGMLHGPVDGEAYLVPDGSENRIDGKRELWSRKWTLGVPHAFETWLYCAYGPVQLAKKIPEKATECVVTVELNGRERVSTAFVCR